MDISSRGAKAFLTAAAVLVALGIVAIAARGSTSAGSGGARRPTDTLLDILLSLYLLSLVAGAALVLYLIALRRKSLAQTGSSPRRDLRNTIGMLVLVAAALFLARDLSSRRLNETVTLPEAGGGGDAVARPGQQPYEPDFAWIPVGITVALIVLAVAGFWWSERRRRRARGELRGSLLADAVAEAVDESLDDLRAEPDPRRAVIAAYARLERVLASHGLPRDPAEAPFEYLRRMLAHLSVSPASARRLTDLFERAKFSQHAVEPEMKERGDRRARDGARRPERGSRAGRAGARRGAQGAARAGARPMRVLRLAELPVFLTVGLVVLLLVFSGRAGLIVHVYVLAVAAVALFHLVRLVRTAHPAAGPSRFDAALRRRPQRPERLPELTKVEREVALGMSTAFDLHYRLRPSLRRTAKELLASRRGLDLDRDTEAARRALGEDAWEIVRGDREPPHDRFGPGVGPASLDRAITSLEAL